MREWHVVVGSKQRVGTLKHVLGPDAIGLAQIIPLALPVEVELPVGVPGEEGTCSLALGALDGDEVEVRLDAVHERVEVPEVGVAGLVFLAHEIH